MPFGGEYVMIWKRSYGYQIFIIFVKYVVYDWGEGAQVLHMTDSKLHLF